MLGGGSTRENREVAGRLIGLPMENERHITKTNRHAKVTSYLLASGTLRRKTVRDIGPDAQRHPLPVSRNHNDGRPAGSFLCPDDPDAALVGAKKGCAVHHLFAALFQLIQHRSRLATVIFLFPVGARTKGDCCAFKRRHRFSLWEMLLGRQHQGKTYAPERPRLV
jgi:hypothetical protein